MTQCHDKTQYEPYMTTCPVGVEAVLSNPQIIDRAVGHVLQSDRPISGIVHSYIVLRDHITYHHITITYDIGRANNSTA